MLEFSKIATLEKNKLSTDAPFPMLFDINHAQLAEDIRLVRNTDDIKWAGKTWTAFPIDIEDSEEDGKTLTARGNKVINKTPMRRFGEPSDLLGAVRYLVSDEASFVTGISIPVDGGFLAYSGV